MSIQPRGDLTTRTLVMPADANPSGDIFGGWVLYLMDFAGGIRAELCEVCRRLWWQGGGT